MAQNPSQILTQQTGLSKSEINLLTSVLRLYPQVQKALIFGSRAKGTAKTNSDIDLAIYGSLSALTLAQLAEDMDELPLPYLFDVKAVALLSNQALLEHIERVGIPIYQPLSKP